MSDLYKIYYMDQLYRIVQVRIFNHIVSEILSYIGNFQTNSKNGQNLSKWLAILGKQQPNLDDEIERKYFSFSMW